MKIYLIRHGQTTGDVEDRFGGDYDDHLTDLGREQSQALAKSLQGKVIEVIFASPRIRAQETAQILAKTLGVPTKAVSDIRERNAYGVLTGMTTQEATKKYPQLVERVNNYWETVDGSEPYDKFRNRIVSVFERLANEPYETVAVVTHSGPIRCLLREVLKRGELESLGDCEFFTLQADGGTISLA